MRIIKNILLFSMLAFASISSAQLTVSTEGGEAAMGTNLEVDVTANLFNELVSFEFEILWDSMVMEFVEVKNFNTDLTGFALDDFGIPGTGSIKDGRLTTGWTNFNNAESLANDSRLFTIVLNAVGVECATSSFDFDPDSGEAANGDFEEVEFNSTGGEILVSGPDCGNGGGGDDDCVNECEGSSAVILSMPCVIAQEGSSICIPITVYNFTDIEAVQAGIVWDPSVMTYTGVQNLGFEISSSGNDPNAGFIFNDLDADQGMIRQFWSDQTGNTPETLADGTVLYELCFDIVGNDGDMTTINFEDIGSFGVEVVQLGEGVEFCLDQGKVTIGDPPSDPVMLIANDVSGLEGDEACVDITVRNFIEVRGYQANLQWDNTVIEYNRVQMLNTTLGLQAGSNFNPTTNPDNLRFTWDNLNPATLDDDAKLFQVCFDIVGSCENTPSSAVTFESTASSAIEFSDPSGMALDVVVTNGSVSVLPCVEEHSCNLQSVSQPMCAGDDGSITVSVDADATCECNWFLNGGSTSIQTTPGNGNCNLMNVGAGTYTFELSDASGAVVCTFEQSIVDPDAITVDPSVSNAGCGDTGSITLNAMGGTGTLEYTWTPNVSMGDSASDLPAGDYTINIFDANDCSITVMRTVTAELDPLAIDLNSSTVINPTCNGGGDGSITPAAMGGCPPYMFDFGGGDGTSLSSGDYTIVVTDSNGATADASFTLTDPLAITLTANVVDESLGMMNGSIEIIPTNGTAPFSYAWSPDQGDVNPAIGLSAGFYDVVVTDANGCTAAQENIEVEAINPNNPPSFDGVVGTDVINCFGDTTGTISGSISDGALGDLTIVLSGPVDMTITLASAGTFNFDSLPAGTYTITVSDSEGQSDMTTVTIDQPDDIVVDVLTGADSNNCDGFIDLTVSGGTEPYTFEWINQPWTTEDVSNVCAGFYDVMITDNNGCVYTEMDIEVADSTINVPGMPCWVAGKVITPNDDGLNDFFEFTCINDRVASLEIFDRYGRQVYTNPDYQNEFNGISDTGVELGEGGYMWVLSIDFGDSGRQVEKGTLTLLRD